MVIHKIGKQKISVYMGFGQHENRITPLCLGGKGMKGGKKGY